MNSVYSYRKIAFRGLFVIVHEVEVWEEEDMESGRTSDTQERIGFLGLLQKKHYLPDAASSLNIFQGSE